ncbi:MAG: hypothetical protein ACOCRX_04235 [Candidatus Woesearchaeota archaeon]
MAKDDFKSEFDDYIKSRRKITSRKKKSKKIKKRRENNKKQPFFKKLSLKDLFHDKIIDYGNGIKIVEKGEFKLKKKLKELFSSEIEYVDIDKKRPKNITKLNEKESDKKGNNENHDPETKSESIKTTEGSVVDYINPFKLIPRIRRSSDDSLDSNKTHDSNATSEEHELEVNVSNEEHVSVIELKSNNYFDSIKDKTIGIINEIKKVFSKADEKKVNLDDFENKSIKKTYKVLNDFIDSISKLDEDEKRTLITHDSFQYLLNIEDEIEEDMKKIERDISNSKKSKKKSLKSFKKELNKKSKPKKNLIIKKNKSKRKKSKKNKVKKVRVGAKRENTKRKNNLDKELDGKRKSNSHKKAFDEDSNTLEYSNTEKLDEDISNLNRLMNKFRNFFRTNKNKHVINIDISDKDKKE